MFLKVQGVTGESADAEHKGEIEVVSWSWGMQASASVAAGNLPARVEQFEEFRELNARTNASLLRPLQAGDDARSVVSDKLDFYRVVLAGGRMLVLLGLFTTAAGFIHSSYRRHLQAPGNDLSGTA